MCVLPSHTHTHIIQWLCVPPSLAYTHTPSFVLVHTHFRSWLRAFSFVGSLSPWPPSRVHAHTLSPSRALPRSLALPPLALSLNTHTHIHTHRSFFHASPSLILPLTLSLPHTHTRTHVLFLPFFSLPDSLSLTHCPQKLGVTPFEYTGYGWEKLPPKIPNVRGSKAVCLHSSVQAQ